MSTTNFKQIFGHVTAEPNGVHDTTISDGNLLSIKVNYYSDDETEIEEVEKAIAELIAGALNREIEL